MDVDTLLLLLFGVFVQFGPFLIIVAVLVGGVLLGCVVVAIAGAVRAGVSEPEETRDVDVAQFFEEQAAEAAAAPSAPRP
ncbi:hypothetical protein [Leifsonia sp. 21MFCrub1.1]|uniref:hypothetical protein n=1 Tax=Leifsonia sp. 21MFCrub1.1 TaxID=1798223 RepID=UPI000892A29F|nr:hypothetical protein [Leifsonia sp. 21MFCrub1.1]SEA99286.1 hypothetical protein SAMN04515680_2519 [Leifsonia sp. 21MFCrub1.1]